MGSSTRLSSTRSRGDLPRANTYAKGVPATSIIAIQARLVSTESRRAVMATPLVRLANKPSCWAALSSSAATGIPTNRTQTIVETAPAAPSPGFPILIVVLDGDANAVSLPSRHGRSLKLRLETRTRVS